MALDTDESRTYRRLTTIVVAAVLAALVLFGLPFYFLWLRGLLFSACTP